MYTVYLKHENGLSLHHHISLHSEARLDIAWWAKYLPDWNGCCKILNPHVTIYNDHNIFTDASGKNRFWYL